jgi:hypothetical protein
MMRSKSMLPHKPAPGKSPLLPADGIFAEHSHYPWPVVVLNSTRSQTVGAGALAKRGNTRII